MTHRHPAPERYKATPEQSDAFKHFLNWRKLLTHQRLSSGLWVKAFRDAARSNEEKQERAAQYASYKEWEMWIHEGPAAGLRRQHQFSKVPK